MINKEKWKKLLSPALIILVALLMRLFPHMPNLTPIGAMALFSGAYLNKKYSLVIVLLTMLVSDYVLLYINPFSASWISFHRIYSPSALFHSSTVYVYVSFLIYYVIGRLISNKRSAGIIGVGALLGSIQFFLITNAAVWINGAYARDLSGLWQSYVMGIPFFRGTFIGDLFYTGAFFASYEFINNYLAKKSLRFSK